MSVAPLFLSWAPKKGERPVGAFLVFDNDVPAKEHAKALRRAMKRTPGTTRLVRVFKRTVKAGGLVGICWVVVTIDKATDTMARPAGWDGSRPLQ